MKPPEQLPLGQTSTSGKQTGATASFVYQPPIVLKVKGIVPSFKTQKTAYGWIDKKTGKVFARPATLPEHRDWMQRVVQSFVSQLCSALQITESTTPTERTQHCLTASLPQDDCWTAVPETVLRSALCGPGEEEGVTLIIERID